MRDESEWEPRAQASGMIVVPATQSIPITARVTRGSQYATRLINVATVLRQSHMSHELM
jgi:hypothetical protein